MAQLMDLLARGYMLVLMCACKDGGCHRWVVLDLLKEALAIPYLVQMDGFEVVYLHPSTNALAGAGECAPHVVSLSGGLGSAVAGERAIQRYGRENVSFWFSDVWKEDEDLYRFLWDLMRRWGGRLYYFFSGKKPEDIWMEHGIIGNNRMCPCSYELKVFWYRDFVNAMPTLPTIYIGYKFDEQKRMKRTTASYQNALPDAVIDYPLVWEPAETRDLAIVCAEELDIIPPRAYALGYGYNNCGGSCCRSGIGGRCLTAIYYPKRYQADMEWEEMMRAKGGALEGRAFSSRVVKGSKVPLTLREILEIYVPIVRAYINAHPHIQISEKTIIKDAARWQRKQAPEGQLDLWEGIEA
jgi:hypothetical protein